MELVVVVDIAPIWKFWNISTFPDCLITISDVKLSSLDTVVKSALLSDTMELEWLKSCIGAKTILI